MGCVQRKSRAILRSLGRGRISNWRTVFSWRKRKAPRTRKRELQSISPFDCLHRKPILEVVKILNLPQTRRFRVEKSRRTKGNWHVTSLSTDEVTAESNINSRETSFSPSSPTSSEWDVLSSSSRIVSPKATETGKPEVETESTVEVASKEGAPSKTNITEVSATNSSEKPEVEVEIEFPVKLDPRKHASRKAGLNERVNQMRENPKVDAGTKPTVKLDSMKNEKHAKQKTDSQPKDSISQLPVDQLNGKPEVKAETKMISKLNPTKSAPRFVRVDSKKYAPRKEGMIERLVNHVRVRPEVDAQTVELESLKDACRTDNISQHPVTVVKSETKMKFKVDPPKCAPQKELPVTPLCEKPEVDAETESDVGMNPKKCTPRKAGIDVTQSSKKPEVDAKTEFSVKLDPRKYAPRKADIEELSVTQLNEEPEVEAQTELTVKMDNKKCVSARAEFVTQWNGKSEVGAETFELDTKKYVPPKANISDPSVTFIDVDDCCVVFEKSVSSGNNQISAADLIEKAVEKEKRIIQGKARSIPKMVASPLIAKMWEKFTARMDGKRREKEILEVDKEKLEEKAHDSVDTPIFEKRVGDVSEGMVDEKNSASEITATDFDFLGEDSDASSVVREPPFAFSPEKNGKSRDTSYSVGSTLEGNSGTVLSAGGVDMVLSEKPDENQEVGNKQEEEEVIPSTEVTTKQVEQAGGDGVPGDIDGPKIPILIEGDTRPMMVDVETNTTSRVVHRKQCHSRTTNLKIRRLNQKVVYLKKLLLFRTRTFKTDRKEYTELLKNHSKVIKNHSKVMKSVLRMLRSQVSLNERLLADRREVPVEVSRVVADKQSSSTQTEPLSEVETRSLAPEVREVASLATASRRLFREAGAKRKAKRPLSLSQPCNAAVPVGWEAIRQKAADIRRWKSFSSMEELNKTKVPCQERLTRMSDDSSDSPSLQSNVGNAIKWSSSEEDAKTAQGLQAVYEEVKADEVEEVENKSPKKRKRIRFELDETEANQPKRLDGGIETSSPLKKGKPNREIRVKSELQKTSSSPEDHSWNNYIKDLVGRLSQDYSTVESRILGGSSQKLAFGVEFRNEDILSYLFLDEQFVFTTRKIDPAFKEIPHDDAALTRIVSELRSSGDIDAAEKAIHAAGILNCANFDSIRKQLRLYLKVFAPPLCYYFQVHLDIQTGKEELRVVASEARCRDDWIDGLEGYKVSVKQPFSENLPKFVADDSKGGEENATVVLGPASFIKQDSSPNIKFVSLDRHTVGVVAIRNILPGEELLIPNGIGFCCKKKKVNHPRKLEEKVRYDRSF